MNLVFNKSSNGQAEIKAILGFLNADFSYTNLEPDIKLNTPYIIDLIGQAVYDLLQTYYVTPLPVDAVKADALSYVQLYIASMAYLDYAPNNDLSHTNSGRTFSSEEKDKIPWDWQVRADESATRKRAYKALDQLFLLLDTAAWSEWTTSEAYQTANALFLKNTKQFDAVFPINKSGQLYYRLVPFMDDFENDHITSILTAAKVTELKAATTPTTAQKTLINIIYKAVAYLSLGKGLKAFPVEMMPDNIKYREDIRDKSEARAEVMQFLNAEGEKYLKKLEYEYTTQEATFVEVDITEHIGTTDSKYVNL